MKAECWGGGDKKKKKEGKSWCVRNVRSARPSEKYYFKYFGEQREDKRMKNDRKGNYGGKRDIYISLVRAPCMSLSLSLPKKKPLLFSFLSLPFLPFISMSPPPF